MARKNITVTKESPTGRNERFFDPNKKTKMTRAGFVKKIEQGEYPGYHVREVHHVKTPASNPDKSTGNNLG